MPHVRRMLALIAPALLATFIAAPSAYAAVVPMSLPELVSAADAVVEVHAVGAGTRSAAVPGLKAGERAPIVTDTRFKVGRVYKGVRPSEFVLTQPGGTIGDVTLLVSDTPKLRPGQRAIVFLDEHGVVGGEQGMLEIDRGQVPGLGLSLAETRRLLDQLIGAPVIEPITAQSILSASVGTEGALEASAESGSILSAALTTPVISSITPSNASAGTGSQVTLVGSGFGSPQGTVSFLRGDSMSGSRVNASIVSWTDTQVVCVLPSPAQSGPARLTTWDGATAERSYTVNFSFGGLRWDTALVPYRINENTSDMVGEGAAIQRAMRTWTVVGARFGLTYEGISNETTYDPAADGFNDIFFSASAEFPSGVLAYNQQWFSGGEFMESNIFLNDSRTWGNTPSGTVWDVETIVLHELGHTVGLDDQYNQYTKVMGAASAGSARRALTSSEIDGINWINGRDTTSPSATAVSSSSHPVSTTWYNSRNPQFQFSATDNIIVNGYSYTFNTIAVSSPDQVSEGLSGNASLTAPDDGEWYLHVRALDAAGNMGSVSHLRVRIDTTPPATTSDAQATYTDSATIALTATDSRSDVASTRWTLDGVSGIGTLVSTKVAGSHSLEFSSVDNAGNREETQTVSFQVVTGPDTVPPTAPNVSSSTHTSQDVWYSSRAPQFSFNSTDDRVVAGYSYLLDGDAATLPDTIIEDASSGASFSALADGESYFHVRAVDASGNAGNTSHYRVRIDGTAPVTTSSATATMTAPAALSLIASDTGGSGYASTRWSLNGVPGTGGVVSAASVGTYTLDYSSVDGAGNRETTKTAVFEVLAPAEPLTSKLVLHSSSRLDPSPGTGARITVRLADGAGAPLAGRPLVLRTAAGTTIAAFSPSTLGPGYYTAAAPVVRSATTFSAWFLGDEVYQPSGHAFTVVPRATLTVNAPWSARRWRAFNVYGTASPFGAGRPVKLMAYRRTSTGYYKLSKTVTLRPAGASFRARVALPTGTWRMRWSYVNPYGSTSYSRWDSLRVR